jgi:trigger factor
VIETRPKIKLAKLSGFKIKKETAQVDVRDLDEALQRLRESLAKYNAVEGRPAAMGDFVVADYVCWVDGKEAEKRSEDWFEIKEDEFLKGFSVQLIGAQPGEQKEVRIRFPENFSRKEWVGKEALFRVTVKEIKTKTLPALDDELAKEAGEYKTLEELRQKIRTDLQTQKDREKESEYEKALLDELLKNNKIDLPLGMVKKRQNYLVEETLERSKRHGLPEEKAEEFKKKIEEESQKEALRQVHLAFLLDEIAVKENLTATEEDLKKKFEILTERFRQPLETIEKYYREHEEAKESLCDQIRSEKAIEFLKRNHQP